jgi:hypothetical protein
MANVERQNFDRAEHYFTSDDKKRETQKLTKGILAPSMVVVL